MNNRNDSPTILIFIVGMVFLCVLAILPVVDHAISTIIKTLLGG